MPEFATLVAELDKALAQLAAVTRQRDALGEAVEAVEWIYRDGGLVCPGCEHIHPRHAVNCGLAAALALVRGE